MNRYLNLGVTSLISLLIGLLIGLQYRGDCTEEVVESSYTPETRPQLKLSPSPLPLPTQQDFSENKLRQYAQSITVKVLSGKTSGSGILIHQQGNLYTVVTNHHVLVFGQSTLNYQIKTSDNLLHNARVVQLPNLQNYDLGLLQFRTDKTYSTVPLSQVSTITRGEEVFAGGFPFEEDSTIERGFILTRGKVEMISKQAFGGGYTIGSTNVVKKGMSGGPLLNHQGKLVGINGIHKYPLWGNPYLFEDGSVASPEKKQQMTQFSWAIPITTFSKLVPQFTSQANQSPSTPSISYPVWFK